MMQSYVLLCTQWYPTILLSELKVQFVVYILHLQITWKVQVYVSRPVAVGTKQGVQCLGVWPTGMTLVVCTYVGGEGSWFGTMAHGHMGSRGRTLVPTQYMYPYTSHTVPIHFPYSICTCSAKCMTSLHFKRYTHLLTSLNYCVLYYKVDQGLWRWCG